MKKLLVLLLLAVPATAHMKVTVVKYAASKGHWVDGEFKHIPAQYTLRLDGVTYLTECYLQKRGKEYFDCSVFPDVFIPIGTPLQMKAYYSNEFEWDYGQDAVILHIIRAWK